MSAGTPIGAPLPHDSALGHVTGTASYVDDLPTPPGTLHVAIGAATIAHGTVTRLGLDATRAAPGVVDVVTAADVPGELDIGAAFPGDPLLAVDTVEFVGQPLFAVAAQTLTAARRAAALAVVAYSEAEPLLDVATAARERRFVLPSRTWRMGDVAGALATAPNRLHRTLYVRGQEHFYLEGQVALAIPEEGGAMHVQSSTQHPAEVQALVAKVLGVPMHRVRVTCRRMGGAFGGKESQAAGAACLAALFAWRLGVAVKCRLPRKDDMTQTGKRHDFACEHDLGYDGAGRLLAARITLAGKCGYSPDLSEGIVDRAMLHATNAYHVPHAEVTGLRCKTHTVSNTAFRGFGGPQGMLPIEAALDDIAAALKLDPLDVRKRNLYAPGRDMAFYGQRVTELALPGLIDALEASSDYRRRRAELRAFNAQSKWAKRGLALTPVQFGISFTTMHLNQAGSLVNVYRDGSIEVNHGGTEMGQGLYTKVRQVAAEAFGVALGRVRNTATRTDKVPNTAPTAASSGSDINGMAVHAACERIKANLTTFAREHLNWPPLPLRFAAGRVAAGPHSMPFHEFVGAAYLARTHLSSTGYYKTPDIHFDKSLGKGRPFYYYAHGAAVAEVLVDTLTGAYRVPRVDILHDAGAALNPAIDLGQIEGGFIQGMGWLTSEELLWDDAGRLISDSPANYKIPTAHECPETFNVAFHAGANPQPTIHRSKAVGEPPLMLAIAVWCALRDACFAAGGYAHLPALAVPATPEAVYRAAREAREREAHDAVV